MSDETTEQVQTRLSKAIHDAGAQTEHEMRKAANPWPKTEAELVAYIKALVNRPHDYGTCVYAMSLAATAAFNFVAAQLGTTGFQASCADMDFIRRSRGLDHGFMIINGNDLLYPQYDVPEKVRKWIEDQRPETAKAARELLAKNTHAHPRVLAHWRELARDSRPASPVDTGRAGTMREKER